MPRPPSTKPSARHAAAAYVIRARDAWLLPPRQVLRPRHPGSNAHAVAFHVLYDYADLRKRIKDGEPV